MKLPLARGVLSCICFVACLTASLSASAQETIVFDTSASCRPVPGGAAAFWGCKPPSVSLPFMPSETVLRLTQDAEILSGPSGLPVTLHMMISSDCRSNGDFQFKIVSSDGSQKSGTFTADGLESIRLKTSDLNDMGIKAVASTFTAFEKQCTAAVLGAFVVPETAELEVRISSARAAITQSDTVGSLLAALDQGLRADIAEVVQVLEDLRIDRVESLEEREQQGEGDSASARTTRRLIRSIDEALDTLGAACTSSCENPAGIFVTLLNALETDRSEHERFLRTAQSYLTRYLNHLKEQTGTFAADAAEALAEIARILGAGGSDDPA